MDINGNDSMEKYKLLMAEHGLEPTSQSQPNIFGDYETYLKQGLYKHMGANQLEPEGEIIADNCWHKSSAYMNETNIEVAYKAKFTYGNQTLVLTAEYYLVTGNYSYEGPIKFTYSSDHK